VPDRPNVIIENQSGKVTFTSDSEGKRISSRYQFMQYVSASSPPQVTSSSPSVGMNYSLISETTLQEGGYQSAQFGTDSDEFLIPVLLGDMNPNYDESRGNYSMNIDYRDTEYSISSAPDYVQNILQGDEGSEPRGSLLMVRDTDERSGGWSEIGGLQGKYKWRDSSRFSNLSSIENITDAGARIQSGVSNFTSADEEQEYRPQTQDI
jgi:hypothetical protein